MSKIDEVIEYLAQQNIPISAVKTKHAVFNACEKFDDINWFSNAKLCTDKILLKQDEIAINPSTLAAVVNFNIKKGDKVLDMCGAPGIKSVISKYYYPDYCLTVNDISNPRLNRAQKLFDLHNFKAEFTNIDAVNYSSENLYDLIIVDAPCSGEGVALGGSEKVANEWSRAKVNRLSQLQYRIVKKAFRLLKPDGKLVYITCTLNKNENERVIKKALKLDLKVFNQALVTSDVIKLKHGEAWRILPSPNSIGFFIAVMDKNLINIDSRIYDVL